MGFLSSAAAVAHNVLEMAAGMIVGYGMARLAHVMAVLVTLAATCDLYPQFAAQSRLRSALDGKLDFTSSTRQCARVRDATTIGSKETMLNVNKYFELPDPWNDTTDNMREFQSCLRCPALKVLQLGWLVND